MLQAIFKEERIITGFGSGVNPFPLLRFRSAATGSRRNGSDEQLSRLEKHAVRVEPDLNDLLRLVDGDLDPDESDCEHSRLGLM